MYTLDCMNYGRTHQFTGKKSEFNPLFVFQFTTTVFYNLQSILCWWFFFKQYDQYTGLFIEQIYLSLFVTSLMHAFWVCLFAVFFVMLHIIFFSTHYFVWHRGFCNFSVLLINKKCMEINFFITIFFTCFAEIKYVIYLYYSIVKLKASLRICWYGLFIHE